MDSETITAAILTAGFVVASRQALNTGRLDEDIREKFIEYLAFVRELEAAAKKKNPSRRKR